MPKCRPVSLDSGCLDELAAEYGPGLSELDERLHEATERRERRRLRKERRYLKRRYRRARKEIEGMRLLPW